MVNFGILKGDLLNKLYELKKPPSALLGFAFTSLSEKLVIISLFSPFTNKK
jgi:hypothetical protein